MKKYIFFGISCLLLLLVMACTTTVTYTEPRFYTNAVTSFDILGEVVYESKDRVGYNELLRAARNMYPNCDYVIDIMVDQKLTVKTTVFFFLTSRSEVSTWVMRGTAIRYRK